MSNDELLSAVGRANAIIYVCALVIAAVLILAKAIEASSNTARCAERGIQLTGKAWGWDGGDTCIMFTSARK